MGSITNTFKMTRFLLFIMLCLQLISCAKSQSNDSKLLETVLDNIKKNNQYFFSYTIQKNRKDQVDTTQINGIVTQLCGPFQSIASLDSLLFKVKYSRILTQHGIIDAKYIIFSLQKVEKDSTSIPMYFWITIVDSNLFDIGLASHPPGIYFVDPIKTPHLDSFSFSVDSVSWFRLWYDAGENIGDIGGRYGYYGLEGNYNKLQKCNVYDTLKEILVLLNSATIDSEDYNSMYSPTTSDDAEYISIRFNLTNKSYVNLNEFEIISCLSESKFAKEELFDYIILLHSKSTRYLFNKQSNPRLQAAITNLAKKDYGRCIETRFD